MKSFRVTAALLLLLVCLPAWAIQPFVADYDASWKGVQADAKITLSSAGGDRWRYELSISNRLGSARQMTLFEERDGVFRPLSGVDTVQVLFKKSRIETTYDWTRLEARWSGNVKPDRTGPVPLRDGDMDGMLLNLAIVRDVTANRPLNYRLVDNGSARSQSYRTLGTETITVAGQPRTATKIMRGDDRKQVIVWIVDGLPTPARILQRKDGKDEMELTLRSVR
ncbi:MAG: DUF3108 domain-containing protein [Thermomonas sp.]|uniref:DUF3108 domain-containing protein n=1 Tax=Thermomonas sp. TaxID=1971895 RepID=UPI001D21DDB7|nr:DUF3108 domain-containing protein [Thermomonas sp.]MBZ0087403.1 DUF3108 domain-containing protein [Thermomonas sp.]